MCVNRPTDLSTYLSIYLFYRYLQFQGDAMGCRNVIKFMSVEYE